MLRFTCQHKPTPSGPLHRAPVRPAQLIWHTLRSMTLPSHTAAAVCQRAIRGAAASGLLGGVSLGVSRHASSVEFAAFVAHAWKGRVGRVPQRGYALTAQVWRSWPGTGAACFSSSGVVRPNRDSVLQAMVSPSAYEPGGLHTALRDLGLDEAVEYLPPELPRVSALMWWHLYLPAAASVGARLLCNRRREPSQLPQQLWH